MHPLEIFPGSGVRTCVGTEKASNRMMDFVSRPNDLELLVGVG